MEQSRSDISQHQHTGYCRCDGATSEIPLRRSEQVVVFAVPKARFQPLGKIGGWLYRGKISEQEKRAANFCIVLGAAFTFQEMSLHANQLDTGESIVYKGKMLITKLAAVHGDRLRVR